jgi:hypothetical protein
MINKGNTVYHYSKGKGYILEIKERRGGDHLIICDFPSKGLEFITRTVLLSGDGEITLSPQQRRRNKSDGVDSILDGLFKGL